MKRTRALSVAQDTAELLVGKLVTRTQFVCIHAVLRSTAPPVITMKADKARLTSTPDHLSSFLVSNTSDTSNPHNTLTESVTHDDHATYTDLQPLS